MLDSGVPVSLRERWRELVPLKLGGECDWSMLCDGCGLADEVDSQVSVLEDVDGAR